MTMKKLTIVLLALMLALLCCTAMADTVVITLDDSGITGATSGCSVDGSVLTITSPGEYILSGSLSNGSVVVNCAAEGKIDLLLNGVDIHNETGSAIRVEKASPRVTLQLMEGTVNKLSCGDAYTFVKDDEPNAVVFSRSDLTITGEGTLSVDAAVLDGIASKDDLRIKSGSITVNAARHGLRGKDCVEITDGTITVIAGKDGIRSTNDKTNTKGYVSITGGKVTIVCGDDPITAVTGITVENATVNATIKGDKATKTEEGSTTLLTPAQ